MESDLVHVASSGIVPLVQDIAVLPNSWSSDELMQSCLRRLLMIEGPIDAVLWHSIEHDLVCAHDPFIRYVVANDVYVWFRRTRERRPLVFGLAWLVGCLNVHRFMFRSMPGAVALM